MNTIRVAKLDDRAHLPTRKNPTDAGIDFYALGDYYIYPHSWLVVRTGITVEIPEGYMMLLKPKGGSAYLMGAGVVDAHYEPGEILLKVFNTSPVPLIFTDGSSVAQGVLLPILTPEIVEIDLDEMNNEHARSGKGGILDGN